MKNSSLINLLQALNAKEFKLLGDFVQSPIHNSNKNCIALYKYLKQAYPDFEEKAINKESIGIKLFGDKEKATKNMAFLMTAMSNLVQEFLIWLQLEENSDVRNTLLLKSLSERGIKKHFIAKYQSSLDELEQQSAESSVSYFGDKYEKLTLLQEFNELNKDDTLPIDLQEIADTFYKHSLLQQLHIAAIIVNKATITNLSYNRNAIDELLEIVERKAFLSETIIKLYYHTLKLLLNNLDNREDTADNFGLLKQTLSEATNKVATNELYNFYVYAHSYCNRQVQRGKEVFRAEAFDLYRQQLAQNALEKNGYIAPGNIRNMVTLGLLCGETAWVRNFIDFAQNKVAQKFQSDLYALNLGAFYFFTKNYNECIEQLHKIENFIDPIYQIEAKSLLLRVYYELNETLAFDALIVSFREYIRYQKNITEQRKEAYLNFISFINKLPNLYPNYKNDQSKLAVLAQEISLCNNISERKWLLDKISVHITPVADIRR